MPVFTFAAESLERNLFGAANFNRNEADKIFTLVMKKGRPKSADYSHRFPYDDRKVVPLEEP